MVHLKVEHHIILQNREINVVCKTLHFTISMSLTPKHTRDHNKNSKTHYSRQGMTSHLEIFIDIVHFETSGKSIDGRIPPRDTWLDNYFNVPLYFAKRLKCLQLKWANLI